MTTAPLRICTTCNASIPSGALYCLACGASSPTEGVKPVFAAPGVSERRSAEGMDLGIRQAQVQDALGAGFEAIGLIGRGGFGEVWSARDTQLGRIVAVKLLRPEISADPEFRKRFRREARAVARLRHPGIVPIYHVGESRGTVWFTMPLVEGVTLRAALAEPGGLTAQETVRILIEAADALREAHAHGIIHRDIKPENIMLEGPQRRVLLMDFGVAKVEEPGGGGDHLTEADIVLGSPEYMSPEQATARALDARSDIYSLGVVAYRMLAGRLPFVATSPREILAHHVLSAPTPLSGTAAVPASVAEAVMRCLAKAPEARWQSVEEFARALAAAAPRASRLAALPRAWPALWARATARVPAFARRRSVMLPALALLVVLGVGWAIFGGRRQPHGSAAASTTLAPPLVESASPRVKQFSLRPSDVPGCTLTRANDTLRLVDNWAGGNCWFAAAGVGALAAPIDYYARFRMVARPGPDAGVGLAWCRGDGECRVAFLWPGATAVWGAHRPRRGLAVLGLGKRAVLRAGNHELRMRLQDGMLRYSLDGRVILTRRAGADAALLREPASVQFVVQNTKVELVGSRALGAVTAPQP